MEFHENQEPQSGGAPGQTDDISESSGVYHGAGVGKKEALCSDPPVQPASHAAEPAQTPVRDEPGTKPAKSKGSRRIIAAVLAAAVLAGSCGLTAWSVNRRWEKETGQMVDALEAQIGRLEDRVEELAQNQTTGSAGSQGGAASVPAAPTGTLNPSQVYAMNVNSVVAISNQTTTNVWGQVSETASSGTGFILSENGYIVSNYHVVEGATKLTVITYMGDEYEAELVGFDKMNDVSILKINAAGLDPVQIGDSDALIVGDQVVAIGNPLGELTSSLTVGYISAKDRTINTDGNLINMMQTDAAINPGNSGGPLFDMNGNVIGITTAKYSGSTTSGASIEGIGFAIPINDVMNMSQDLMDYGYLKNQAYMGITVMDLPASTANMYSLPTGSYVRGVVEGGCADIAGIQPKDIIIAIGPYAVDGNTTLAAALRKYHAGDTATITVYRAGAEVELTITFDERPQDPDAEQAADPRLPGEMPSDGSYEEWYEYFEPFFGGGNG